MAIASTDIILRYSTTAGSSGDSNTGDLTTSLGKYVANSTNVVVDNTANNLFADITGDQNTAAGTTPYVDYKCIFVLNNHATLTLQNAVVYLSAQVSGGASADIAVDNIAVSAKGGSSAQAATIASSVTAPSGVSAFSQPSTKGTGLTLGNIGPGQVKAIWVRRTLASTVAAQNNDGGTIAIAGDTAA
jgi:hypothetical protein